MSITQRWLRSLTVPISAPGGSSITNGRRHACLPVSWFRDLVGLADKIGLSSSFGGDSNRSDIGKRLLSSAFADLAGGSQAAHLRPCPFPPAIHGRRATTSRRQPPTPEAGGHRRQQARPRKPPAQQHNRRGENIRCRAGMELRVPPAAQRRARHRDDSLAMRPDSPPIDEESSNSLLMGDQSRSCDDPAHRCGLATRGTPSKSR